MGVFYEKNTLWYIPANEREFGYTLDINLEQSSHLEKILLDAICDEPVKYDEVQSANEYRSTSQEKYRKYQKEKYTPEPHYQREE